MPATISVNFATQAEVETAPQPTTKSVSAKVLADVLGGGSLGGGYVRIAGSTMTGPLTLNAAPTQNLHAATKKYVDDNAYQAKYRYNVVSPTSTISGLDVNNNTLQFTSTLNVDVYRNGVLMVGNGVDYTANPSPTNSIVFTTLLAAGAVVQVNVGGVGSILAAAPGVAQIQAGSGITLSPAGGTGTVLVNVNPSYNGYVPTGAIMSFYRYTAPDGWLICDGNSIPSQYTSLIALVGANTPNLRGMFIRGWSSGTATTSLDPLSASRTLGSTQQDAFESHYHSNGYYPQSVPASGGTATGWTGQGPITGNTGSVGELETRPVNIALLYCIKT